MPRRDSIAARLWKFISSRGFSFVALASLASLLVVWLIPFQIAGIPEANVERIATTWTPFLVAYGLILVATLACTWVRFRRDYRRARSWADSLGTVDRRTPFGRVSGLNLDELEDALLAAGFQAQRSGEGIAACRRPWAILGGSAMHFAVILLAVGLALHAYTAVNSDFRLIEGETLGAPPPGMSAEEKGVRQLIADARLDSITPVYFKDVLLFSALDAQWTRVDGRRQHLSLSDPVWLDPFTYVTLQDYGYAPHFQLKDAKGALVGDSVVALDIVPPGTQATQRLQQALDVSVIIYPDHGVRNGRDVSLTYNLRNPRLLLTAVELGEPSNLLARKLVGIGEAVTFGKQVQERRVLTVSEVRRFGTFRATRSYGMPLIAFSLLTLAAGVALRVFGRRLDLVVWSRDGELVCDAHSDMEGRTAARAVVRRIIESAGGELIEC